MNLAILEHSMTILHESDGTKTLRIGHPLLEIHDQYKDVGIHKQIEMLLVDHFQEVHTP
jgi:hypothetical protein